MSDPVDAHEDSIAGAIRVAARALIVEEGRLLVMTYRDENGVWCVTPGGGIAKKETLAVGLKREIQEELGFGIEVGDVVYVRELMGATAEVMFGGITPETHQLEIFFRCKRLGDVREGPTPDKFSTGPAWVPLKELPAQNFLPEALAARLQHDVRDGFKKHNNYLGDA